MFRPRWLQPLHSLGLEFWLLLPLLGLVFWVGGGLVTDQMLSRSGPSKPPLQAGKMEGQPEKMVLLIKVEINRRQGLSKVKVKTANSALKQLEFEFPVTKLSQVEAAIGQELGLSPKRVRKLVSYHLGS